MRVRCDSFSLQGMLRRAILEHHLWVAYQPILDCDTGRLASAEALMRWTTPEGESISPAEFIPVAEASGLIVPMGEWILRDVCSRLRGWIDAGLPAVPVAVNLSAKQFFQEDLVEVIGRALADAGGLNPRWLHLEVTESVAMREPERSSVSCSS